jgi:hypothetical protein
MKMTETIQEDIIRAVKTVPRAGESAEDYTRRVVTAVGKLSEEAWEELPDPAKNWNNKNLTAMMNNKSPPFLLDVPEAAIDAPADDEDIEQVKEDVVVEVTATPRVRGKVKAKAPVKKAKAPVKAVTTPAKVLKAAKKALAKTIAKAAKPAKAVKAKTAKPAKAVKVKAAKPAKTARVTKGNGGAAQEMRPNTKQMEVVAMVKRPKGASVAELSQKFGWLPHTVRALISVVVRRKMGLDVVSSADPKRGRVYHVA